MVINIDTWDYEIDIEELDAYDHLIARQPEAQVKRLFFLFMDYARLGLLFHSPVIAKEVK